MVYFLPSLSIIVDITITWIVITQIGSEFKDVESCPMGDGRIMMLLNEPKSLDKILILILNGESFIYTFTHFLKVSRSL